MKSKGAWFLIATVVLLVGFTAWSASAQLKPLPLSNRPVWEYKVVYDPNGSISESQLNELGAQGWELILYDSGDRTSGQIRVSYTFKRVK